MTKQERLHRSLRRRKWRWALRWVRFVKAVERDSLSDQLILWMCTHPLRSHTMSVLDSCVSVDRDQSWMRFRGLLRLVILSCVNTGGGDRCHMINIHDYSFSILRQPCRSPTTSRLILPIRSCSLIYRVPITQRPTKQSTSKWFLAYCSLQVLWESLAMALGNKENVVK